MDSTPSTPPPNPNADMAMSPAQCAKLPRFYQAAALKPRPDVVAARSLPRASDRLAAATALRDRGRKLLGQGQWAAAATELEGALGVIKYLEPLSSPNPIHDTEQQPPTTPTTPQQQQPLLREVNLMAAAASPSGGGVLVSRAARTLAVHCLLGLGAAYFHMGDAQSCIAACDEALATESHPPSPPKPTASSGTGGGLMGPPPSSSNAPRAHRAQALFWRARARAASVVAIGQEGKGESSPPSCSVASKGGEQQQHKHYVMTLALKDLGEAVRLEPGDRAIRGEYFRLKRRVAEEEARAKRRSFLRMAAASSQAVTTNTSSSSVRPTTKHSTITTTSLSSSSSISSTSYSLRSSTRGGNGTHTHVVPSSAVSSLSSLASVTATAAAMVAKQDEDEQHHQQHHAKQEAALLEASTSRSGHTTSSSSNSNKRSQPQEGEKGKGGTERARGLSASGGAGADGGGAEGKGGNTKTKKPATAVANAGPAVIGSQMRRLAWVAREREQAGDATEAAQLREAVAECKEWLQHAPTTAATGSTAAAGGSRARLVQSKIKPLAVGGVTGAGGVEPLALRRRSSSADTSLSVSSKTRGAATRAAVGGEGGASLLGAKMREAEAAWALGLDLADPRVVEGLRALREPNHGAEVESPVRAVLRRTLLLLLAAFALGGAVAGGAVAAWGGKYQHAGHRGLAGIEPSSSSPVPLAAVEWVGVEGKGQGRRQRRERTAEETLLLVARTVVPVPIRVVGEEGEEVEEDNGVVGRSVVVVP